MIAAPLTKGSANGAGVNAPGRRLEDDVNLVHYGFNHTGGGSKDVAVTADATPPIDSSNQGIGVLGTGVRRLTPRECERLQGLPDDWTLLEPSTPDSRRYSALGDAVTASVGYWIGCRL